MEIAEVIVVSVESVESVESGGVQVNCIVTYI